MTDETVDQNRAKNKQSAEPGEETSGQQPTRPTQRLPEGNRTVKNEFRRVSIGTAYFGGAFGPESSDTRDSTTGEILLEEIQAEIAIYAEPDCFTDGATKLTRNRALIIQGQPGIGRRTSALALIAGLEPEHVQRIQPGVTLEELQTWKYEPGTAYVVFDHVASDAGVDAEFRWDTLLGRLKSIEHTCLVITRTGSARYATGLDWQRPDPAKLMLELLAGTPVEDRAGDMLEQLPEDWTLTNVVECCRRLVAAPDDVGHALAVFNRAAVQEVADWFDADPSRRDTVEITALAFAVGLGERRFEEMADEFEKALARHVPPPKAAKDRNQSSSDTLNRRRRIRQSAARELIRRAQISDGLVPQQVLQFRTEHHWRAVLEELHANYASAFWDAVSQWIQDLLDDSPTENDVLAVAHGLAGLSLVDVGETLSILDGLTPPQLAGLAGIDCAAVTLSLMANDDAVAPTALQIAIAWLGQHNLGRRLAAGQALIQSLGLKYTAEASRRLWQLIAQDDELSQAALSTPALLFASLVSNDRDASELLAMVLSKVERFNGVQVRRRPDGTIVPRDQRMVDLSLNMTQLLLGVANADTQTDPKDSAAAAGTSDPEDADHTKRRKEPEKRRTSVFAYLQRHPESADTVARLWIALLRNRRYRFEAMQVLWDGLRGCADQAKASQLIGAALARNFKPQTGTAPSELDQFITDFRTFDRRKQRRPDSRLEPVADMILQYLETIYGMPQGESA